MLSGCKKGDQCPYSHDPNIDITNLDIDIDIEGSSPSNSSVISWLATQDALNLASPQAVVLPSTPGAVPLLPPPPPSQPKVQVKPLPETFLSNPRAFELNQLRRRFNPTLDKEDSHGTLLGFRIVPSDPDFRAVEKGFKGIDVVLRVPVNYLTESEGEDTARPSLMVMNRELGADVKRAIRIRFEEIVKSKQRVTLLRASNLLDRRLVEIFNPTSSSGAAAEKQMEKKQQRETLPTLSPAEEEQRQRARLTEIHQLQSRFQKDKTYSSSRDLQTFTIPVSPANRNSLPPSLKSIHKVILHVPLLYPLEPCTIEISGACNGGDDEAAKNLEWAFEEHVRKNKGVSLVSHVNFLGVKMHVLAKKKRPTAVKKVEKEDKGKEVEQLSDELKGLEIKDQKVSDLPEMIKSSSVPQLPLVDTLDDKPHVQVIPRPPEWDAEAGESSNEDSDGFSGDEDSSEYDSDEYDFEDEGPNIPNAADAPPPGRHVALSFPEMSMQNIELLYIRSLALAIKCERCKETDELKNLVILPSGTASTESTPAKAPKTSTSCKKCGILMAVEYRHELMHQSSNRAGYLIMDGCTALDILPSQFIPTCASCSTTSTDPYACVRGGNFIAFCKKCHQKMHCHIPDVKFLLITSNTTSSSNRQTRPRKHKEILGIHAGTDLPRRGRCTHYAKSYRWFRFSCCQRVFPCDKCHDAASDHLNEHANRMICGFCSREQNYRPETCGMCHATLTGKTNTGFWEGGKGTRDRVRMSRKDPRKFKRRGGGVKK